MSRAIWAVEELKSNRWKFCGAFETRMKALHWQVALQYSAKMHTSANGWKYRIRKYIPQEA